MAKSGEMAAGPKIESSARFSWPSAGDKGVKLSGDVGALALGKRVRIITEGIVKSYSMHEEYGCDMSLNPKVIRVDAVSDSGGDEDEGPSMADTMGKMGKKHTKPY